MSLAPDYFVAFCKLHWLHGGMMLDTWELIFRTGLQNCLTCALLTIFYCSR